MSLGSVLTCSSSFCNIKRLRLGHLAIIGFHSNLCFFYWLAGTVSFLRKQPNGVCFV